MKPLVKKKEFGKVVSHWTSKGKTLEEAKEIARKQILNSIPSRRVQRRHSEIRRLREI